MKLPLHTEQGQGKYVDLIDANGGTIALDLTPVSGAHIANATNHADELADALQYCINWFDNHRALMGNPETAEQAHAALAAYRGKK